jgi:hypothetical protein
MFLSRDIFDISVDYFYSAPLCSAEIGFDFSLVLCNPVISYVCAIPDVADLEGVNGQSGIIARAPEESGLVRFNRDGDNKLVGIVRCVIGKVEAKPSVNVAGTVIKGGEKK